MKRKQEFLNAVQILAPGDAFILKATQQIPEESLPLAPGGIALKLVGALNPRRSSCGGESAGSNQETPRCHSERAEQWSELSMSYALRVQSAYYWLKLGETDQALLELGALSTDACNHPLAVRARLAVLRASWKANEFTLQE